VSRYVYLNPVRAGVVNKPERFQWSSYPGYVWKRKEVLWVEYAWVLSQFGLDRDRSKKSYREFVCRGLKETPFKELCGQVILGKKEFIEKAKGLLKGGEMGQEIVERRRWPFIRLNDIQVSLTRKLANYSVPCITVR
jgi:hypothetical protein